MAISVDDKLITVEALREVYDKLFIGLYIDDDGYICQSIEEEE